MTIVVTDSTVLLYLAKLGDLDFLQELFDQVLVPEAVYAAVVERGHKVGYRDALAIKEKKAGGVDVVTLSDAAAYEADQWHDRANLGRGEAAAITLARRRDARCLTDDHAA